MRNVLVAALLLTIAPVLAGAQGGSAGGRTADKECEACARDSSLRLMQKRRIERRDHLDRVTRVAHELSRVRRALEEDRELSSAERRRLRARASRLEAQLRDAGARLGLELSARTFQEMQPAMAEARRAIAAAMGEAGVVAAAGFTPEGVRFPGWIGITLDAPCTVVARGGDVYWRFLDHPEIVSVDPSSPAERAGIRQGDVLLAYDGQDVRREIAMNRLLQPGRTVRVRVRVRRDNEVREVPVKVAPLREIAWREWAPRAIAARPAPKAPPRPPREKWVVAAPPEPPHPMAVPDPRGMPSPVFAVARINGLAGAHMETITPRLGEAIGVERGVLVLSVAPGVPAQESGLIDGDVILRADGRDVDSVHELRSVLASSDERAVKLDVARKGKVRVVVLRW